MKYSQKPILVVALIIMSLPLMSNSCEEISGYDNRLTIVNNSDKRIFYVEGVTYPDTSIGSYNPVRSFAENGANPHSSNGITILGKWEESFKELPVDTLMIFIFDADTLEQVPWDKIRSEYKILKRYDLSLQDLKDRDWKVVYP
jgi:hypothetical protein